MEGEGEEIGEEREEVKKEGVEIRKEGEGTREREECLCSLSIIIIIQLLTLKNQSNRKEKYREGIEGGGNTRFESGEGRGSPTVGE